MLETRARAAPALYGLRGGVVKEIPRPPRVRPLVGAPRNPFQPGDDLRKAIRVHTGGPEVMKLEEISRPSAAAGQAVVKSRPPLN
jgi:hypothetical protein